MQKQSNSWMARFYRLPILPVFRVSRSRPDSILFYLKEFYSAAENRALYGEAMSSALILETVDLPDKSSAALHIFRKMWGAGFSGTGFRTIEAVMASMPGMVISGFTTVSFPSYPTILRDRNTFQQTVISGPGPVKPVCLNFTAIMVTVISGLPEYDYRQQQPPVFFSTDKYQYLFESFLPGIFKEQLENRCGYCF